MQWEYGLEIRKSVDSYWSPLVNPGIMACTGTNPGHFGKRLLGLPVLFLGGAYGEK
jgi:hypothetical protein